MIYKIYKKKRVIKREISKYHKSGPIRQGLCKTWIKTGNYDLAPETFHKFKYKFIIKRKLIGIINCNLSAVLQNLKMKNS